MSLPGSVPLADADPELHELILKEKERQVEGLEMIASENFTSRAVMECLGSCLTNKYAEGYPGARYYGGNEYVDQVESLCIKRALEAFKLKDDEWFVNVQPYSGSPANFAVYAGLLQPHDRLMGLNLPDGGHLTHGFQTPTKKISKVSYFFESVPYHVLPNGYIDYDSLEKFAIVYRPKILIAGYSAYPRELDYVRFRDIADKSGALLMVDMAHFAGLVVAEEMVSPFAYADIVTTTTHKSLRGPRAGMVFGRLKKKDGTSTGFLEAINTAVFPGLQGGPHVHQIAAIATMLKDCMTPDFKVYAKQVKANSRKLAEAMQSKGMTIATGGTDNHLLMWDLRPHDLTGAKMEKLLEKVNITVNKNTIAGDKSAMNPGGVRVGTPALTTRGCKEKEMEEIAGFYDRAIKISTRIQGKVGKQLKDFVAELDHDAEVTALREDVKKMALSFPMPGL